MSKKVLILSCSPRKGGNSDYLCEQFLKGAREAGHDVEKIFVSEKNIGYCRACYACRKTHKCIIKDDMAEILDKMIQADILVLSSLVYFYSIHAQIKTVRATAVSSYRRFCREWHKRSNARLNAWR